MAPSWGVSWAVLPSKMVPESEKIRHQNQLKFGCLLGSAFYWIFSNFWSQHGSKLGPTSIKKSMSTSKSDFFKIRTLAAAGARFFRFGGSKLEVKSDQNSMTRRDRKSKASWTRSSTDFGGFGRPSWVRKSDQIRSDLVRSGQVWSDLIRSRQISSDQVRSSADRRKSSGN